MSGENDQVLTMLAEAVYVLATADTSLPQRIVEARKRLNKLDIASAPEGFKDRLQRLVSCTDLSNEQASAFAHELLHLQGELVAFTLKTSLVNP